MRSNEKSIHSLVSNLIDSQRLGLVILILLNLIIIVGLLQDIRFYLDYNKKTWTNYFTNQISKFNNYANQETLVGEGINLILSLDSEGKALKYNHPQLKGVDLSYYPIFLMAQKLNSGEELIHITKGILESKEMVYYVKKNVSSYTIMTIFPEEFFPLLSNYNIFTFTNSENEIVYSNNKEIVGTSNNNLFYIYKGRLFLGRKIGGSTFKSLGILYDSTNQITVFVVVLLVMLFFLCYNRVIYRIFRKSLRDLDRESNEIQTMTDKLKIVDSILTVGTDYNLQNIKEILISFIYQATAKKTLFSENKLKLDTIKELAESVLTLLNKSENIVMRLNEAKNKYQSIYENSQEGIFQATPGGALLNLNGSLAKTLGFENSNDLILKISQRKYEPFMVKDEKREFLKQIIEKGSVKHFETSFKNSKGQAIPVVLSGVGVKDESGKVYYIQGSVRDLTSEQIAKQLKEDKERAEAIALTKSAFFANVSHELRTPLNAVIGFSELLGLKLEDEELKEYTDSILIAGKSLLTLITDVLDLSKLDANKMEIINRPVSVATLLEEVSQIFSVSAHRKGLEIELLIENLPESLLLDESRLRQVLINLVGNSIKFTNNGFIRIKSFMDGGNLCIEVEDSGRGIEPELQEDVFSEFKQVGEQKGITGSGLGLTICRRLVKLMGGEIGLESEVGKGSSFSIILFNVEIGRRSLKNQKREGLNNLNLMFDHQKVLVIDDTEQIRDYVQKALSMLNLDIITAEDGISGLKILEDITPDLVLLDIKMPGLDGFEVCKNIRDKKSSLPIIAFTASTEKERDSIIRNGFTEVLNKPIVLNDLIGALSKYLFFTSIIIDQEPFQEELDLKLSNGTIRALKSEFSGIKINVKVLRTKDIDRIISILESGGDNEVAAKLTALKSSFNIEEIGKLLESVWEVNMGEAV